MQFFFLLFFFFPPGWLASFFSRHVLFICRLSTEFKTTPSFRLCRVFEDGWDYLAWFSSPASSWQVRPGTLPLEGLWGVVIPVQARCPAAAVVCYHKQSQVSMRPAQWLPVAHPEATHLSLLSIWNVQRDQFCFYQLSFNFTCDFFCCCQLFQNYAKQHFYQQGNKSLFSVYWRSIILSSSLLRELQFINVFIIPHRWIYFIVFGQELKLFGLHAFTAEVNEPCRC